MTLVSGNDQVEVSVEQPENVKYLFTTATCPNCRLAKQYLADEKYITMDANENVELATKYGIMQAPTLVVIGGGKVQKYAGVSKIKKYVDEKLLVPV